MNQLPPVVLASWPLRGIRDVLELRELRRRMPYVYRRLISVHGRVRQETDESYLERLRDEYRKRHGGANK